MCGVSVLSSPPVVVGMVAMLESLPCEESESFGLLIPMMCSVAHSSCLLLGVDLSSDESTSLGCLVVVVQWMVLDPDSLDESESLAC